MSLLASFLMRERSRWGVTFRLERDAAQSQQTAGIVL